MNLVWAQHVVCWHEGFDVTAHYIRGHTRGGTTWTWQTCEESGCLDVVYADTLSARFLSYAFGENTEIV